MEQAGNQYGIFYYVVPIDAAIYPASVFVGNCIVRGVCEMEREAYSVKMT